MEMPLLQTKLYIPSPRTGTLVSRSRLIDQLNVGLDRKLVLISAPAGFGKTTLVSNWVRQTDIPAAWLSLDERDNDFTRFLAYLVSALQTIGPNIGDGILATLQSPQPSVETTLTTLLNDLTALPNHFVLVLDDYHVIETQAIDDALTFLLEYLPPPLHLVIITRADPPLPLARLRAGGQLTELRATDLRFTPAEAADFLNQAMGLNLSAQDIAALESRTEGWIAGLQLAALALQETPSSRQGHQNASDFIQSFTGSHRFVMDYLVEEVLHRQPESIQRFLLYTSILNRLCSPLCDAVIGQLEGDDHTQSQKTLEHLEQANLFLVPLDNERRWYRYHHLFADLLRQRLHQNATLSTEDEGGRVAEFHIRASRWYEATGLEAEAFHHALVAEDFERAARLVELAWPTMERNRQAATWLGWVKALPDELIQARPVLSVGYAWALLDSGELEASETRLRDAERWLDTPSDRRTAEMVVVDEVEFRFLPATIATARAYHALALNDVPGTVQYARRAFDLLPEENYLRRGTPASLLGLAYWASEDLEAAHQSFAEAMTNFQKGGNVLFAITGTHVLADIRLAQGCLQEAVKTYHRSLQLATKQGGLILRGAADLYTRLSELSCEQDDQEAAKQHLLRSEALDKKAALPRWRYRWCVAQARLKAVQGDLDNALNLLDAAERNYIRGPVPDVRPITAMKTRVWIRQGKLSEALAWAREQNLSVDDGLSYLREFEYITFAQVLIAQYRNEPEEDLIARAVGLLDHLLQAAEAGGRQGSVIEILVQQALAHEAQGNISAALVPLKWALSLAEPESYVRTFVDEGTPLGQLLSEITVQESKPTYANTLLAAFEAEKQRNVGEIESPRLPAPTSQSLVEPLSQRELEILHLIAQGLSNREISERLFLALPTVKGHNRNIFGKLAQSFGDILVPQYDELLATVVVVLAVPGELAFTLWLLIKGIPVDRTQ